MRASAVRLVGNFGKTLAAEHSHSLEGVVHFVLSSLVVEGAAEHAAIAFRSLCVHAKRQLGRQETVLALLRVCEPALSNVELTAELRIALAEGLARLVAELPSRDDQARLALTELLRTPCTLLQNALQHGATAGEAGVGAWRRQSAENVATQVALVGAAIRFCDRYNVDVPGAAANVNPVLPVMQSGVWDLLLQVFTAPDWDCVCLRLIAPACACLLLLASDYV